MTFNSTWQRGWAWWNLYLRTGSYSLLQVVVNRELRSAAYGYVQSTLSRHFKTWSTHEEWRAEKGTQTILLSDQSESAKAQGHSRVTNHGTDIHSFLGIFYFVWDFNAYYIVLNFVPNFILTWEPFLPCTFCYRELVSHLVFSCNFSWWKIYLSNQTLPPVLSTLDLSKVGSGLLVWFDSITPLAYESLRLSRLNWPTWVYWLHDFNWSVPCVSHGWSAASQCCVPRCYSINEIIAMVDDVIS